MAVAIFSSACGRAIEDPGDLDAGASASASNDGGALSDALRQPIADAHAAIDASDGATCSLPPSVCIDDDTLRYWIPWTDGAAGPFLDGGDGCGFVAIDVDCEPGGFGRPCAEGACQLVLVR
jgi:hypothetical protein